MATPAQILANRQNAERSTGPVTAEGKARVSHNATRLGLFSVANFVRPEEQDIFNKFESGYMSELSPVTLLEQTLAREIIQAAWRLRRCANLEIAPPESLTDEELGRLQTSIDRARAAAQRTFHRSLKELRRLQSEHLSPAAILLQQAMATDTLIMQEFEGRKRQFEAENAAVGNSAKQTQFEPAKPTLIPRGAPCPCKSGQKYKRCCGRNALPVLFGKAA
jgi:SEC-C motif